MSILSYISAEQYVQIVFLVVAGALLALLIVSRNIRRGNEFSMQVREFDRQTEIEKRDFNEKKALVVLPKGDQK